MRGSARPRIESVAEFVLATHIPTPSPLPYYDNYVESIGCELLGRWKLGDGGSPFLDSSGHVGGAVDMSKITSGTAMTDSVVGALSAGQDDGAVQFNAAVSGDRLAATNSRFDGNGSRTAIIFVKPTNTWSGNALIFGTYVAGNGGWVMLLTGDTHQIIFLRNDAGGSASANGPLLTVDEWAMISVDWNPGAGVKIYKNGVIAHTDAVTQGVYSATSLYIGASAAGGPLRAAIDEASYWGCRLTADQHAGLYEAAITE